VTGIAGANQHTLALKSDSSLRAWGWNGNGQLGNGNTTTTNTNPPVTVLGLNDVKAMSGGWGHSLALRNDGTVWAWGYNYYGQLGNNSTADSWTPIQVKDSSGAGFLSGIIAIAAGNGHSLALKNDGTIWAWGFNYYGQLGVSTNAGTFYGSSNGILLPVQVQGLPGGAVTAIAGGSGNHSLALINGTVYAWGWNNYGQLGTGTASTYSYVPVLVSNTLAGITAISAGAYHNLALKNDNTVWAWGWNNEGQMGNGATSAYSATPAQVSSLTGVTAIASGGYHNLALKSDGTPGGTVWAWGRGGDGQLGNNSYTNRSTPVQVTGPAGVGFLSGVTGIAAGGFHSIALNNPLPPVTPTPTVTPTTTPAPTATPSPTPAPMATPSPTPAATATPTPTASPTASPTPTPSPTASPTASPSPTPTPVSGTIVQADQGTLVVGSSGQVAVSVNNITDISGLGAYDLRIDYNPGIIQLTGVTGGAAPFSGSPTANINNTLGRVTFNAFQTSAGPTGNIIVAYLLVNAVGFAGQVSPLTVTITTLASANGDSLPASPVHGSVTIFGADFNASPTHGSAPLTVLFTDASAGVPGGPQSVPQGLPKVISNSWLWDFGDGTIMPTSSSTANHTYTRGGNYTVALTIYAGGITNTKTKTNYIQVIQADFVGTPTSGVSPLSVAFTDQSSGTVNNWSWTFGDGTGSSSQNPTKLYNSPGAYNVALTVTGPAGTSVLTRTEYVNVMSIQHTAGFSQVIGADGIVYLNININRIYNPSTQVDQPAAGGIGAYDFTITYPGGATGNAVNLMAVKGAGAFASPLAGTLPSSTGSLHISSSQTGAVPQPPLTLAQVAPRIIGSSAVSQNIVLAFNSLADVAAGANIPTDGSKTYPVRRGDARQDNNITITDALFIAQTLAGLRDVGEGTSFTNAINGASTKLEATTVGEKLTIADALLIAQMLAGIRDASFN